MRPRGSPSDGHVRRRLGTGLKELETIETKGDTAASLTD